MAISFKIFSYKNIKCHISLCFRRVILKIDKRVQITVGVSRLFSFEIIHWIQEIVMEPEAKNEQKPVYIPVK
jgi:hypothetical protein